MKKVIALVLVLLMAMTACGALAETAALEPVGNYQPVGNPDGVYRIAFVASWLGAEYFSNNYAVLQPMLEEAGMEIELFGPADYDTRTETQLSIIENLITSGEWDVILLYVDEPDAVVDLRLQSEQAGIPWIGYIMTPETNCGTIFIGDTPEERAIANYEKIIEYVEENWELYEDLDVIEVAVAGHPSNEECNYRCAHTGELLEANTDYNFEVVYEQGAVGADAGVTFAENCLQAHPNVKIWLANADDAAIGIYQALNNAGMGSDADQIITGIDAGSSFRELCAAGTAFRFSSYCVFSDCAETLIEVVPKLCNGEYEYQEEIPIPTTTVSIDNIDIE